MEHNLEDSLNLESDIGGMDFDHSEDAAEITLESSSHGADIPMEFETMEDKQGMLMDTGSEEVLDFMGDHLTLQEYSIGDDQTSEITTTEELNIQNILQSQSDTMVDLQFEPQIVTPVSVRQETQAQPKYIAVKVAMPNSANKRGEPAMLNAVSRQVAIAPKPPKLVQTVARGVFPGGKQYAIAPKPVALISNKTAIGKGLTGLVPANKAQVLAQVGKQLIMMPSGSQKIKLVPASQAVQFVRGDPDQAHITPNKTVTTTSQGGKSLVAKVVMQGANQPAVITKLMPSGSTASPQTRYVMQQKTVPISIGNNKVLLTSPTKQGKKQLITLKSAPGLTPIQPVTTTKKVVISANPAKQKLIVKAAPTQSMTTAQVNKDGKFLLQSGQRTQLHKIDVPGKGIQFIRLVTNPKKSNQAPALNISTKNLISLTEKAMSQKPQQKFVRIAPAPVTSKSSVSQPVIRSGQSLLTPITSAESAACTEPVACKLEPEESAEDETETEHTDLPDLTVREESKSALAALIADAVADEQPALEIEYGPQTSPIQDESTNSIDQMESSFRSDEHPLIVIPANYLKNDARDNQQEEARKIDIRFEPDGYNSFQSPTTPPPVSESDANSTDLSMRPRKACNCTKSQCLKLYCDCFANGEFCNRCNCNNCHNNLENEELRQKSIRACLLRNPNAFRPKIGKSKTGGPEIIRRHNKGCNCKRSGCLKNYCECYEAKIACTAMCKCVGCRNVEESVGRARRRDALPCVAIAPRRDAPHRQLKQPCSFMTMEVIEAVCQCLVAAGGEAACPSPAPARSPPPPADPVADVIEEFARCLQDIISASLQSSPVSLETQT